MLETPQYGFVFESMHNKGFCVPRYGKY